MKTELYKASEVYHKRPIIREELHKAVIIVNNDKKYMLVNDASIQNGFHMICIRPKWKPEAELVYEWISCKYYGYDKDLGLHVFDNKVATQ